MIGYVNNRLVMWSEWVARRDDAGLGFPKECSYTRLMQRSGGAGYQPEFASEALEIDRAMTALKKRDPQMFRAVHLFYGIEFKQGKALTVRMTKEQIAKDLGRHRDTVYDWIDRAHRVILDALHEVDPIAHMR